MNAPYTAEREFPLRDQLLRSAVCPLTYPIANLILIDPQSSMS
jgi:hypothetical protein